MLFLTARHEFVKQLPKLQPRLFHIVRKSVVPHQSNCCLQVGVALEEKTGAVIVDAKSRTNVPSISAVGDVTDRIALTPVALMEGMAFAKNIFGGDESAAPDYKDIASAVFSSPPLASVGLTEEEAAQQFDNLDLYTSGFR